MLYLLLAALTLVAWLVVEVRNAQTWIRLSLGGTAVGIVGVGCWSICMVSSQFDKTMRINNITKNLTNGLVEITSKPIEIDQFRERLNRMNNAIVPSYEDHSSAENAITEFLSEYHIEYLNEMPITVDNMYKLEPQIQDAEIAPTNVKPASEASN